MIEYWTSCLSAIARLSALRAKRRSVRGVQPKRNLMTSSSDWAAVGTLSMLSRSISLSDLALLAGSTCATGGCGAMLPGAGTSSFGVDHLDCDRMRTRFTGPGGKEMLSWRSLFGIWVAIVTIVGGTAAEASGAANR